MRVARRILLVALGVLLASHCFADDAWRFEAPPTSRFVRQVDSDWRVHGALLLHIRFEGQLPASPVLCSIFIHNKQDLWITSRMPLLLTGKPQELRLDLSGQSPDWKLTNARRRFDADLLRWVCSYGVEIFCREEVQGALHISDASFEPAGQMQPRFDEVLAPAAPSIGEEAALCCKIPGFRGNPFSRRDVRVEATVTAPSGAEQTIDAFFTQNFAPVAQPGRPAELQPRDLPYWKMYWTPTEPGQHQIRLAAVLGTGDRIETSLVSIVAATPGNAQLSGSASVAPDLADEFSMALDGHFWQWTAGTWVPVATPARAWQPTLAWTPEWGNYTGIGEFDLSRAARLEQLLDAQPPDAKPAPLVVFTDDVADDQGRLNWKDHPLNAANGGTLQRPHDLYRDPQTVELVADSARYLWSRFGGHRAVSGMVLVAHRPEPCVTNWLNTVSAQLAERHAAAPIFAVNNYLEPTPPLMEDVVSNDWERWRYSRKLSGAQADLLRVNDRWEVRGASAGAVGIVSPGVRHWAGLAQVEFDVEPAAPQAAALALVCLLRTEKDIVFQSDPAPLLPEDMTRAVLPLQQPESWHCLQDPARRLGQLDLLNVREVGLRVFSTSPEHIDVTLHGARVKGPRTSLASHRPLAIEDLVGATKVPQYEKFELQFGLNRTFRNPYDPRQVDVLLAMTGPDGVTRNHPGYFHETMVREEKNGAEQFRRTGTSNWRVRMAPLATGPHTWKLTVRAGDEVVETSGTFTCVDARSPGFVGLDHRDPRQFSFSNGEFYYPLGLVIRSPGDERVVRVSKSAARSVRRATRAGTQAYRDWFQRLETSGANFVGLWMSPWWCGLEWDQTYDGYHGLGYYNQANAARLDAIIEYAEQSDIYLAIDTFNHGCLSVDVDADWGDNPLNKTTQPGGFLRDADEFFLSARAKELHERKVRYTIARWGYSTAVAWWGILTEGEWLEAYRPERIREAGGRHGQRDRHPPIARTAHTGPSSYEAYQQWIADTGGYLQTMDAHPHPTSMHFASPQAGRTFWKLPNIDIVRNNAYTSFVGFWPQPDWRQQRYYGVADIIHAVTREQRRFAGNRPFITAEWGGTSTRNDEAHLATEFHVGHWAMLMTDGAGDTGFWWHNVADAMDLFPVYAAIARYMEGEDRRQRGLQASRAELSFQGLAATQSMPPADLDWDKRKDEIEKPSSADATVREGLVLSGKSQLDAYIYCRAINRNSTSERPKSWDDETFLKSGPGTLLAPERLASGTYQIEYWNTFTGEIAGKAKVTLTDDTRGIPIPSHRVDMAIKVRRL